MAASLLERITEQYVSLHLNPKQGQILNQECVTQLRSELEIFLNKYLISNSNPHSLTLKSNEVASNPISPADITRPIEYSLLFDYAATECDLRGMSCDKVMRLRVCLEGQLAELGIHTYDDLIKYSSTHKLPLSQGSRDPFRMKNIGVKTLQVFYSFLQSRGVDIFDPPYRSIELLCPIVKD